MRLPSPPSLLLLLLVSVPLAAQTPPALDGHWEGQIATPPPLGIHCDFSRGEGGAWRGTIDIPAQGAKGLALEGVAADGAAVRFAIAGIPGAPSFAGTLDGNKISGQFKQGGQSFDFQLEKKGAPAAPPKRPQLPAPPFPYREVEVKFGHDQVQLAGTLTLPPGEGPFPALMLFSGSGLQDRDSTVFGHKPFLVLADRLTRAGFAVLRADDRGIGGSQGDLSTATTADFIEDASAGIRFLAARPDIDPSRLGMYGHSEGAQVAAGVAARGELDFVILAAGSGVEGSEIILEQQKRIAIAGGMPVAQAELLAGPGRELHRIVKGAASSQEAAEKLKELGLAQLRATKGEAAITAADRAAVDRWAWQLSNPWMRHFLSDDPARNQEKIKIPVLVIQGELDLQVPADQNLPKIEAALAKAGNRDVQIRRLPGLNHLLQPAKTGLPGEYGEIETTIDESALSAVTEFLGRFKAPVARQ